MTERNEEQEWRQEWADIPPEAEQFSIPIACVYIMSFVGFLIGLALFSDPVNRAGYVINVFTSVLVVFFNVGVINKSADYRAYKHQVEALKLQMGSPDNGFAREAVRQIRTKEWWYRNLLRGIRLVDANLCGADMRDFVLSRANARNSNLAKANLWKVNFQMSNLSVANLSGAGLRDSVMTGANCYLADLSYATLAGADLSGACLLAANLTGANVVGDDLSGPVKMDNNTVLPNNTKYDPERGIEQLFPFIDEKHPQFWNWNEKVGVDIVPDLALRNSLHPRNKYHKKANSRCNDAIKQ